MTMISFQNLLLQSSSSSPSPSPSSSSSSSSFSSELSVSFNLFALLVSAAANLLNDELYDDDDDDNNVSTVDIVRVDSMLKKGLRLTEGEGQRFVRYVLISSSLMSLFPPFGID